MTAFADLVAEHCPDGVEFKTLGDVGKFTRGNGLQKKELIDSGVGAIHYGQIFTHYGTSATATKSCIDPEVAKKLRKAKPGDLVIATTSENDADVCKAVAWLGSDEVAVSGDAYVYSHKLDPRFVSYFFQSSDFQRQKAPHVTGTKVRRVNGADLATVKIPVPPTAVQERVVEILDKMERLKSELSSELESERERRSRQLAFYRDTLLTVAAGNVDCRPLGDVAEVRSGWGFPVKYQGQSSGDVPFYKVSDMNLPGNEVVMGGANHYVTNDVAKLLGARPAPAGTVVFPKIGAAIATNKKRILSGPACYDNNVFGVVPGDELVPRFLMYLFQTVDLLRFANHSGAVPSIRKSTLEEYEIPVPPIAEQERIATVLDALTDLVAGLTSGLAAEIEARRKQYEYYRDKLLTFEEKTA